MVNQPVEYNHGRMGKVGAAGCRKPEFVEEGANGVSRLAARVPSFESPERKSQKSTIVLLSSYICIQFHWRMNWNMHPYSLSIYM
jgi:hypothetical protein